METQPIMKKTEELLEEALSLTKEALKGKENELIQLKMKVGSVERSIQKLRDVLKSLENL